MNLALLIFKHIDKDAVFKQQAYLYAVDILVAHS